jgi:hypothetical protein
MNCRDFRNWLAQGRPLTGSAEEHLRTCVGCRMMLESLHPPGQPPDAQRLARLKERIGGTTTAVRPLPSDESMFAIGLLVFLAFSILLAAAVGFQGFLRLNALQRICDYAAILVAAALFSLAIVPEIVPGARRRISLFTLVILLLLALSLTTVTLFPNFDLAYFVKRGVPCLRFGLVCAAISAALGYWLIKKGYASSPVRAGAIFGGFTGLVGVAALALHCPILNAAHILVWHCGAILISALAGALLGSLPLPNRTW